MGFKAAICVLASLHISLSPALAGGLVPLRDNQSIVDRLVQGRMADVIRKTCPTIEARMFVAIAEVNRLKSDARRAGYSSRAIRAFIDDPEERKSISNKADSLLRMKGAVRGDVQSYCSVGRAEIANGGLIGRLLRDTR